MPCFFLVILKIFFFVFSFQMFVMYLSIDLLEFLLCKIHSTSWIYRVVSSNLGSSQPLFLPIFSIPFFPFSFWDFDNSYASLLYIVPHIWLSTMFFTLHSSFSPPSSSFSSSASFFFLDYWIGLDDFYCTIFKFTCSFLFVSIMLLNLSNKFYFIVFFSSKMSIVMYVFSIFSYEISCPLIYWSTFFFYPMEHN